jgi:hypothetical protein
MGRHVAAHMRELMPCMSAATTLAFACNSAPATEIRLLMMDVIRGVRPSLSAASISAPFWISSCKLSEGESGQAPGSHHKKPQFYQASLAHLPVSP